MKTALFVAIAAAVSSRPALALDAAEIFEKASPSVFAVRAIDAQERPLRSGSAVAIGQEILVTSCHLLAKAQAVQVRRGNVSYGAVLEHADVERDLCILRAAGLVAQAATVAPSSELHVGQRAYAITSPEKLALSLSDGLISGSLADNAGLPPIQTTTALGPGASGGGLFDERARLIGIVTLNVPRANLPPNVNFASPAQWIAEVPERAKVALEKRDARPKAAHGALAAGALPAPGSVWTYRLRDRVFPSRDRDFSVQLASVEGWNVTEIVSSGDQQATYAVNAHDLTFYPRAVNGEAVFELSPYLLAQMPKPQLPLPGALQAYPSGLYADAWKMRATEAKPDTVAVPAGRFEAVRVVVKGENPAINQPAMYGGSGMNGRDYRTQRFEFTAWYVPELGRYVQVHHRMLNRLGEEIGDELIQLTKFDLPAGPIQAKGQ
jgi:trypsin-like peptidase